MGAFWENYREDIIWAIFIFLIVTLAFGLGFTLGSRFYQEAAINISCPADFFEGMEVPRL